MKKQEAVAAYDTYMALGAFFGVGTDPVGGFRIIRALLEPELGKSANAWTVVFQSTAEAEEVAACASHGWNNMLKRFGRDVALDGVGAVGRGTPAKIRGVIDVCSIEERFVSACEHKCCRKKG